MFTTACCLVVGFGLGLGLDLVSGCAQEFVRLSVVIVTQPMSSWFGRRTGIGEHLDGSTWIILSYFPSHSVQRVLALLSATAGGRNGEFCVPLAGAYRTTVLSM